MTYKPGDYPLGKWCIFVIDGKKLKRYGIKNKYRKMLRAKYNDIWTPFGCESHFVHLNGKIHGVRTTGIPRITPVEIAESFSYLAMAAPFLSFDCQIYRDNYDNTIDKVLTNDKNIKPALQFKVEDGKFSFTPIGNNIYVRSNAFSDMILKPGKCDRADHDSYHDNNHRKKHFCVRRNKNK